MLQSVSELLEKFQKSKHAFNPNLDHDSEEAEDWAPSQPEFLPESPAGDGRQEFQPHGDSLGHSNRWGWDPGMGAGLEFQGGIPSAREEIPWEC